MFRIAVGIPCLLSLAWVTSALPAANQDDVPQEKSPRGAALTPGQAGPDFQVQGEYAGTVETDEGPVKYGAQVIALGEGKFRVVGYRGGLPGAGWDGSEKHRAEGRTESGRTTFVGETVDATIDDGVMTIRAKNGRQIGELKRTIRKSPTLGQEPPDGAVVLFDGTSAEAFKGGRMTEDGLLIQGATSKRTFKDFTLHLEFMLSYMPHARGQARSNSGVYMQGRHEVQIVDSFGLEGKNNECGAIYGIKSPDVNMCFPPLSWQTYDVEYTAARYDEQGNKTADARMTVRHNGALIHDDVEVPQPTTAAILGEGPEPGPLYIQDHGNPLRFRNIWIVENE